MISKFEDMVSGELVVAWIIIAFLVVYFIYKEYPEFKKRISKPVVDEKAQENMEKTLFERLDAIEQKLREMEAKIQEVDSKLTSDYNRINTMEKEQKAIKKMQRNSLEERGIIMRALLAIMEGAPDNEMIQSSEKEINEYLIKQSHADDEF